MADPTKPVLELHNGILVVRDDLFPGGTKARYIPRLFDDGAEEVVYASPVEGGAQIALATVAGRLGRRATIFCAKRAEPHPRTRQAHALGAKVVMVAPGYLSVVQARAKAYCVETGACLAPFGMDMPEAVAAIAGAAASLGEPFDEVWCASGSGVLPRALAQAWPLARRVCVQVGRALVPDEVAGARIEVAALPFGKPDTGATPFPCDRHYEAKAWHRCVAGRGPGRVLFWSVLGDPTQ